MQRNPNRSDLTQKSMERIKIINSPVVSWIVFLILCSLNNAENVGGIEVLGGDDTDDVSVTDGQVYPQTLEEVRNAILKLDYSREGELAAHEKHPPSCFSNGRNRCLKVPAATVRDYLRTLAARLVAISKSSINYNDQKMRDDLAALGCLSVAIIDHAEVQATVGLFNQGVVSRVRLDSDALEYFKEKCNNELIPIAFHQHEKAINLHTKGQLNREGACEAPNTGGHHDPGYACGPNGASRCKQLDLPPSSALEGTPLFTGKYNCTPEIYALRPFACHAGDISGKLGVGVNSSANPSRPDFKLLALDRHGDNPCTAVDNKQSLVLHCHSTTFRIACAPFRRVETAGEHTTQLLRDLVRTAILTVPYAKNERALLASLVLIHDVEKRIEILEKAADIKIHTPPETITKGETHK